MPKIDHDLPPPAYDPAHSATRRARSTPNLLAFGSALSSPVGVNLAQQGRPLPEGDSRTTPGTLAKGAVKGQAAPDSQPRRDETARGEQNSANGKGIKDRAFSAEEARCGAVANTCPARLSQQEIVRALLQKPIVCACYACGETFAHRKARRGHWDQAQDCKLVHDAEILAALQSDEYHMAIQEAEKFVYWAPSPIV